MITIDGIWAHVGSSNLDNRSVALNDEINVSIQHTTVAPNSNDTSGIT